MPRRKPTETETAVVVDDMLESSDEDGGADGAEATSVPKKTKTKKKKATRAKRKAAGSAPAPAPAQDKTAAKKPRGRGSTLTASEMREQMPGHVTLPEDLKVGMRLSNVESMRVRAIGVDQRTGQPCVDVVTDNKTDGYVRVMMSVLGTTYKSPDVCKEVVHCCKTNIIHILRRRARSHLFWIKFTKKPKKGEVVGEAREMYARLVDGTDDCFGYTMVSEQMVDDPKHTTYQQRQIDNRTVKELKFDGIHYIVK